MAPVETKVNEDTEQALTSPVSAQTLSNIVAESCEQVLNQDKYDHEKSSEWNQALIEKVLAKLIEHTKSYKFVVYVTLIDQSSKGPSGIQTSNGAYWNANKDGVWNTKYEAKKAGIEAVVSIAWIHAA